MPSLWKKHQKGNRISRIVSDIQTTPKKGGSLVLQTGFPTSLVDLFHKNRDKLKKPSTKRLRSQQPNSTTATFDREDQLFRISHSVTHPHVSASNSQLPISSTDPDSEKQKEKPNDDMLIEEIVECSIDLNHNVDCEKDEYKGVIYSKIIVWLCVLMWVFIVCAALYYKRFVWSITLVALLVVLLECADNKLFSLFMCFQCGLLLSISKVVLIVIVVMYCNRFVVGITMGAIMLFIFDHVGKNSFFRLFKPCNSGNDQLRGWDRVQMKRAVEDELGRANYGELLEDKANGVIKSEIELGELLEEEEEEKGSSLNGEIVLMNEDVAVLSRNNHLVDEENRKSVCEMNTIDQNYSEWPRKLGVSGSDGCCEMPGKKGRVKKGRGKKFWKKLVPKHKKKKHYQGKENHEAENRCVQEYEMEVENPETACVGESSTTTSSEDEEVVVVAKCANPTTLSPEKEACSSYKMVSLKDRNLKCMALMVIPLVGLFIGRMFALILTVICCVAFKLFMKMIRY